MIPDEEKLNSAGGEPMAEPARLLVLFLIDDRRFALPLSAVEKIVRVVEITPLPNAPSFVLGIIDVAGAILPVLDMRRRLGLAARPPVLGDQLLLVRTSRRRLALLADRAGELLASGPTVPAQEILPGLTRIEGVATLPGGLVLIHDPDLLLSPDEAAVLDPALDEAENP